MKLIHGASIKNALREVSPISIAVAYVGIDWTSYIDTTTLRDIVLSPTIGTNPSAIAQLAARLGWDNVHFLDHLHAKVYLGAQAAAVGSFNLTANGLSAKGLEEAGFLISEPDTLAGLRTLLETYKAQAAAAYPTVDDKLARLAELRQTWDRAVKTGVIRNDSRKRKISEYTPTAADEAYVCCVWGQAGYSSKVVSPSTIHDVVSFDEKDNVEPDRWILCWHADDKGYPDDSLQPYWLHIDEVISGGAVDKQYTKLAIERTDRQPLSPPFELSEDTARALHTVLRSGRFPEFLGDVEPWSLDATLPRLGEFFAAVREEAGRPAAEASGAPLSGDALRQLFQSRIREAMDIAAGLGVIGHRIQAMLQTNHAVTLAKRLVIRGDIQSGLRNLGQRNALHLSFEHIMLEPQFASLFTSAELSAATWRLKHANDIQ
jgi:hypothetical protein